MIDSEAKTLDRELSALDWEKELQSKYSDKLTGIFGEITSKNNFNSSRISEEMIHNQYSKGKLSHNIQTVNKLHKLNKLKEKFLSIDQSRVEKLQKAKNEHMMKVLQKEREEELEKLRIKNKKQGNFNANSVKGKNEIIFNQISSMLEQMQNIQTSSSDSFLALDSLLNSHKNFIIVNKFKQFKDGIPILKLKRENFMEKTKPYMNRKQLSLLEDPNKVVNRSSDIPIPSVSNRDNNSNIKIKDMLNNIKSKGKKIFSTELSEIHENKNYVKIEEFPLINPEAENVLSGVELNGNGKRLNKFLEKKEVDINSMPTLPKLPKLAVREMSVDIIPQKKNLYSNFQIRDILNMAKIKKPPFK